MVQGSERKFCGVGLCCKAGERGVTLAGPWTTRTATIRCMSVDLLGSCAHSFTPIAQYRLRPFPVPVPEVPCIFSGRRHISIMYLKHHSIHARAYNINRDLETNEIPRKLLPVA